jgi:hypothetical protein
VIYERSLDIEQRLARMIQLIRSEKHSTRTLAQALGISIPTVSRCLAAVRRRGHVIEPRKRARGWHYVYLGRNCAGDGRERWSPNPPAGDTSPPPPGPSSEPDRSSP